MKPENYAYCESCDNKSFENRKGIVCALTSEKPDFQENCDSFILNEGNHKHAYRSMFESSIRVDAGKRFANYLFDYLITLFLIIFIAPYLVFLAQFSTLSIFIGISLILAVYYFFTEKYFQKTVGKVISKTIVVDKETFEKPSDKQLLIRTLFRLPIINTVDAISFLLKVNLHDTVSNTLVVESDKVKLKKARILKELSSKEKYSTKDDLLDS